MMEPIDWFVFIQSGEPKTVSVTRINAGLRALIGCSSDLVRIGHNYALKCTHKHRLTPDHFYVLPEVINHGRVIADKKHHLTFFYLDYITYKQWFQATIKCNEDQNELWVATFHAAKAADVRRLIKRAGGEIP